MRNKTCNVADDAPWIDVVKIFLMATAVLSATPVSAEQVEPQLTAPHDAATATVTETALTDTPCPVMPATPPGAEAAWRQMLTPGTTEAALQPYLGRPEVIAYQKKLDERSRHDWPGLCQYKAENAALTGAPRAVFLGDSITEMWPHADPMLFGQRVLGRGIGGQTTPQMLVRFFQDVVDLHPLVVHIMAGINDLAGNTGPSSLRDYQHNLIAMAELAKLHHIRVVLGSVLPASAFPWKPELRPAGDVVRLNRWLRGYARRMHFIYVDYYAALTNAQGGMRDGLSNDGVHPNADGYNLMHRLACKAISMSDKRPPCL
jgi:lysophospholipase L1-like esterase